MTHAVLGISDKPFCSTVLGAENTKTESCYSGKNMPTVNGREMSRDCQKATFSLFLFSPLICQGCTVQHNNIHSEIKSLINIFGW